MRNTRALAREDRAERQGWPRVGTAAAFISLRSGTDWGEVRAFGVISSLFVSLGWLLLALILYAAVIGLDLHWNLFSWQPQLDYWGLGLVVLGFVVLGGFWLVAGRVRGLPALVLAGAVSVFLVCVGVYVAGVEPLTQEGLIPRTASSPVWYRLGRLALLGMPGLILWLRMWRLRRSAPAVTTQG